MSADLHLNIETGVTWQRILTWSDGDGVRHSLAGLAARMQAREAATLPVLLELSSEDGTIALEQDAVDGDTTGTLTLIIPGSLTAGIFTKFAYYDLLLTTEADENGEPITCLIKGFIFFDLRMTRDG